MKLLAILCLALLASTSVSVIGPPYPLVCTEDTRIVFNDVMFIIEAFMKDLHPDYALFKKLVEDFGIYLNECWLVKFDLGKYAPCVETVAPIEPWVVKLYDDIKNNQTAEIANDMSNIGLIVLTKVYPCIENPPIDVMNA